MQSFSNRRFLLLQIFEKGAQNFSICAYGKTNEIAKKFPVHKISAVANSWQKFINAAKHRTRPAGYWTRPSIQFIGPFGIEVVYSVRLYISMQRTRCSPN
jgi:hypothetical protein